MLSAHDKGIMESYQELVVRLPAKGYGTTEFDMSGRRRDALVAAGRAAMQAYFFQKEKAAARGLDRKARQAVDEMALKILA